MLVKENADFISLLINTTHIQAQALLDTVTVKQVHVISEIFRNLLKIPLGDEVKKELEKNEKIVRKIADSTKRIGVTKKGRIIGIHRKKIINILKTAKSILEAAIGRYCQVEVQSNEKEEEKEEGNSKE